MSKSEERLMKKQYSLRYNDGYMAVKKDILSKITTEYLNK